ncbi:UNVERIFIED_CONTAM: hypothetical protein Sindi_2803500 [Sesamum indicum]
MTPELINSFKNQKHSSLSGKQVARFTTLNFLVMRFWFYKSCPFERSVSLCAGNSIAASIIPLSSPRCTMQRKGMQLHEELAFVGCATDVRVWASLIEPLANTTVTRIQLAVAVAKHYLRLR